MSKRIERNEIAEEGVLNNLLEPLKKLITSLDEADKKLKGFASSVKDSVKSADDAKGMRELEDATNKTNKAFEQKLKLDKERARLSAELVKIEQQEAKLKEQNDRAEIKREQELERLKQQKIKTAKAEQQERERLAKAQEKNKKKLEDENNAYKKLAKEVRDYKNESKRLGAELLNLEKSGQKNTKAYKDLENQYRKVTVQAQKGDAQLKKLDKTVGDNFRNVGNYEKATRGLSKALGALGIAFGFSQVVRNVTGIVANFDQAVTDLGAISGKTAEELKPLKEQARQLGATTQFSATEVTNLQIELAKLGFTTQEIMDSTGGIANFAAATGADIPRAAALAGSALRAFNMEATEIDRVVSTLGVATTKTALDFSMLETGLSTVAPVASAFGFSIEDTTALLGQLANAGFDASSSATATRNILLNLADANGALAQELGRPIKSADDLAAGLAELEAKGVDLATSLELTDKRSVAMFQTFLANNSTLVELRDSITDVNDELKSMADKRMESVNGALKLLGSAFEDVVLNIDDATGASQGFTKVITFVAENLTKILGSLTRVGAYFLIYSTRLGKVTVQQALFDGGLKNMITSIPKMVRGLKTASISFRGLGTAMKSIPFVAIIGFATELYFWLKSNKDETDNLTDAEKKRNATIDEQKRLQEDMNNQLSAATSRFVSLIEQLKQTNKNSKEREILIKRINDQYGTTLQNLKDEKDFTEQLNKAVDVYIKSKKQQILIQQNETAIGKLLKEQIELEEYLLKAKESVGNAAEIGGKFLIKRQKALLSTGKITQEQYDATIASIKENIKQEKEGLVIQGLKEMGYATQISRLKEIDRLLKSLAGENLELDETPPTPPTPTPPTPLTPLTPPTPPTPTDPFEKYLKADLSMLDEEMPDVQKVLDERLARLEESLKKQSKIRTKYNIENIQKEEEFNEAEKQNQIRLLDELIQVRKDYGKETIDLEIERANLLKSQITTNNNDTKQSYEQLFNDIKALAVDAYTNMADNAIDALKQQEEASAQMYDALANMAAQGNITAQQSLAEQIKAQEDAQKAQMEIEKKKQKIQLISQGLGVFGSLLDSGQKPTEALANTAVSMSALVGLINSLPSFDVGTENTGKNGKGVDGKGGFISILHPNERVMTAEQNAMTAGLSNPMLADVAYQFKTGQLVPAGQSNSFAVINELVQLRKTVEKQPQMITGLEQTLGGMMKLIVTEKKGHHKNTNTYKS